MIDAVKVREFTQTTATQQEQTGASFLLQVRLRTVPDLNTTVQLRVPGGATTALQRAEDGSFWLRRSAISDAALEAAFPDGDYVLLIGSWAPFTFAVRSGPGVEPVLITNLDALQRSPTSIVTIQWQPVPPFMSGFAAFALGSYRPDEMEPRGFDNRPADLTSASIGLPVNTPVTVELAYRQKNSTEIMTSGFFTIVGTGRGFVVRFPLMRVPPPPFIISHPSSLAMPPGGNGRLSVQASGLDPLTYQWKKDGTAIPGATNRTYDLPQVQVSDAGSYAVEVSDAGGTVTSDSATVAVAPAYRFTVHAGVVGRSAIVDGGRETGSFGFPRGMAVDRFGNLFVADRTVIRRVAPDGTISTIAGQVGASGSVDGIGSAARFQDPSSIAIDAAGNLYVAEPVNNVLRKITPAGVVSTLAGQAGQRGFVDAVGAAARFQGLTGVAVDGAGNVFVSDGSNHLIRKITPAGEVSTIAGRPGRAGFVNGVGVVASFNRPEGLAIDRVGNLYVADDGNGAIRLVTLSGHVTTLYSGRSSAGFDGIAVNDTGEVYVLSRTEGLLQLGPTGSVAWRTLREHPGFGFFSGVGLAVDANGDVFITDSSNAVVRRGTLLPGSGVPGIALAAAPQSQVVASGGSAALTVFATGPSLTYQWYKDGVFLPDATTTTLYLPRTTAADIGAYTVRVTNALGSVVSAPVALALTAPQDASRLVNLSVRARSGAGAQTLTVGAVVGGATGGDSAPIVVRGIGPALHPFGVSDALKDPVLTVFRGAEMFAGNDNWGASPALAQVFADIGAFALENTSLDAALMRALTPGMYSIQIAARDAGAGVALAEIYDVAGSSAAPGSARLVNLSTRAEVGSGDGVLIAGFTIGGSASKTLLIRAVGPTLRQFGVTGTLANPQLRVFVGDRLVAGNDEWDNSPVLRNAFASAGAFPLTSQLEAVALLTLSPGSYSAQVSGVQGDTGVGLVEIYELP